MAAPSTEGRSRETARRSPGRRPRRGQLGLAFRTWGGKREGAGRKPKGERAGVPHGPRPELPRRLPLHVTLRMAPHVWNLRSRRSFRVIARSLAGSADRFDVQIVQFSTQGNHIHLLVEARSREDLARALKGLSVRLARGLNRLMGRSGRVLADRYHARVLATPTEVRRARAYIRDNARRHAAERGETYSAGYVDPCSSDSPALGFVLPAARTWLVREGWRRGAGP